MDCVSSFASSLHLKVETPNAIVDPITPQYQCGNAPGFLTFRAGLDHSR